MLLLLQVMSPVTKWYPQERKRQLGRPPRRWRIEAGDKQVRTERLRVVILGLRQHLSNIVTSRTPAESPNDLGELSDPVIQDISRCFQLWFKLIYSVLSCFDINFKWLIKPLRLVSMGSANYSSGSAIIKDSKSIWMHRNVISILQNSINSQRKAYF